MRVGVFFPGFDPTAGGGYTFEKEILEALTELATGSHHDFRLYFGASADRAEKSLPAIKGLPLQWVEPEKPQHPMRKLLSKVAAELGWASLATAPKSPLQNAMERDQIQLLWYATCIYWPVDIPYIATMWDIQHRVQPWFPEVSYEGEWDWDYREAYYGNFLRRATYIITPNQAGQNELAFFYQIPAERFCRLTHPAPRIEQVPSEKQVASVLEKYNLSTQYLFYPAQFWPHKNHINLLKALRILREEYQMEMDLVFTGFDQGNLQHIQRNIAELGLGNHVHFLNFIPRDDLLALYTGAFALTYVTYFGPENLPPLEAFACGCPVVASDVPGSAEQLGDAALLVNGSRSEEIARAVRNIYENPQLRASLIEKGKARAKQFTGPDYVRGVFSLIDEFEAVRSNWP